MRYAAVDGLAKPISTIGLGTWQFGSREWGYGDAYLALRDDEVAALSGAADAYDPVPLPRLVPVRATADAAARGLQRVFSRRRSARRRGHPLAHAATAHGLLEAQVQHRQD